MEKITDALHRMINFMKKPSFLLLLGLVNLLLIICLFRCVKKVYHIMWKGMPMHGKMMKHSRDDMYYRGGYEGGMGNRGYMRVIPMQGRQYMQQDVIMVPANAVPPQGATEPAMDQPVSSPENTTTTSTRTQ